MIALDAPSSLPTLTRRRLAPGQLFSAPATPGATLTVLEGLVWITLPNDPTDHLLTAGQSLTLPPTNTRTPAKLLAQALRAPAVLQLLP